MSSKYLVTGATGFLGKHLVRALVDAGHTVSALVRKKSGDLPPEVTQLEGDVLDPASIEAALAGCDGVFHCAGKVSRKPDDAEELYKLHVEGTKNVTAACIARGVRRVVVASTSGTIAVSDDPDRVATEDDETPIGLLNRWPYYRSKLFAEQVALERHGAPLADGSGRTLEVVCVNPTLLLGPGDVNGSSTEDVRLFLERKIPAIPPGGLSYVDARDAANAMVLAMERGVGGRRYLIGASNLTIKEFFARLERVSGVRGPVLPMPRQGREIARTGAEMLERLSSRLGIPVAVDPISLDMGHFYWYLDASLAESELGWAPRDPVETLVDTVRDLEERGVVWPDAGGSGLLSTIRRHVTNLQDNT
ncbi:MAG: NAD-dependent epimerase/dehydratase family protein [Labilithrix sp.]|nr:NAD-dependent epimerase/dehydratase family protein [Labilithrix sp.]